MLSPMGKEKQKQNKGRGKEPKKPVRDITEIRRNVKLQLHTAQQKPNHVLGIPSFAARAVQLWQDRWRQGGGKGMLQRAAGHRQQFGPPRRVAAIL